jgi:hypothetical protein
MTVAGPGGQRNPCLIAVLVTAGPLVTRLVQTHDQGGDEKEPWRAHVSAATVGMSV